MDTNIHTDTIIHGKNPYMFGKDKHVEAKSKGNGNRLSQQLIGDDPAPPKKVTREISMELISFRNEMKLKQKELAQKMNIDENIYSKYEKEGTIIDNAVYGKIKNYIGRIKNTKK
jgi:ribosome-binding protein aMBF1 (putative translation factor)